MGASHSKKVFKEALKKHRKGKMQNSPKYGVGSNSSSKNLSSPISKKLKNGSSSDSSKALTPILKETKSCKNVRISEKSRPRTENVSSSTHGFGRHRGYSVSPAPLKSSLSSAKRKEINANHFEFKQRNFSCTTSENSTDSVNSILSNSQSVTKTSDSSDENSNNGAGLIQDQGLKDSQSSSSISDVSSGVTSAVANYKFKTKTGVLPAPQSASVLPLDPNLNDVPQSALILKSFKTLEQKSTNAKESSPSDNFRKYSRIPHLTQIPSPNLRNNQACSLISRNKNSQSTDSDENALSFKMNEENYSSHSKKKFDNSGRLLGNKQKSSSYLSEGTCSSPKNQREKSDNGNKAKENSKNLVNANKLLTAKDEGVITYGVARQKFTTYNRSRIFQHSPKAINKSSFAYNIEKTPDRTGIVRQRVATFEKSAGHLQPKNTEIRKKSNSFPLESKALFQCSGTKIPKYRSSIESTRQRLKSNSETSPNSVIIASSSQKTSHAHLSPKVRKVVESGELVNVDSESRNGKIKCASLMHEKSNISVLVKATCSNIDEEGEFKPSHLTYSSETTQVKTKEDKTRMNLTLNSSISTCSPSDESENSFEVLLSSSLGESPVLKECHQDLSASSTSSLSHHSAALSSFSEELENSTHHLEDSSVRFPNKCDSLDGTKVHRRTKINKTNGSEDKKRVTSTSKATNRKLKIASSEDMKEKNNQNDKKCDIQATRKSHHKARKSDQGTTIGLNNQMERKSQKASKDKTSVSHNSTMNTSSHSVVGSSKSDALDLDFLIDDEIADQPGLTFGDDLDDSLFGDDEDLFSNLSSPAHSLTDDIKPEGCQSSTAVGDSSLEPDDLMLEFDSSHLPHKSLLFNEELLSPVATNIIKEWPMSIEHSATKCVTEDNVFPIIPLAMSPDSQTTSRSKDAVMITESTSHRFNDVSDQVKMMEDDSSEPFNLGRYPKEMVLKSPRREVFNPVHGSARHIDQTTLKGISQDVVSFRTLLQELQNVLQVDDNCKNASEEKTSQGVKMSVDGTNASELEEQNFDLKRQIVLMRQQLAEKDRTIKSLQERLASNSNSNQIALSPTNGVCINAATQTNAGECGYVHNASIFNRHSPVDRLGSIQDDGLGPTVSFRIGKVHLI